MSESDDQSPPSPLPVYQDPAAAPAARRAFTMHDRIWKENRYVYPVVSRRSKGISLGINLNPDKVCNFDCIYCSIDRTPNASAPEIPPTRDVDLPQLRKELAAMISIVLSGALYKEDPFNKIPEPLRRLNDIAFSGDGEPTTCPQFDAAVKLAADLVCGAGLSWGRRMAKLVLITNASMFHKPDIRETLAYLDEHNGEIWAKLDAGTEDYYKQVDRSPVPFSRILENLQWCCQTRPTVIQTLLMKVHGQCPSTTEIEALAQRLADIQKAKGNIKLVQLYTVARKTTESYATALEAPDLETIATHLRDNLPWVPVAVYP